MIRERIKNMHSCIDSMIHCCMMLLRDQQQPRETMKNFAFISRHVPTQEQIDLCEQQDINLIHIGDFDAFSVIADDVEHAVAQIDEFAGELEGVIVVHPAAALRLQNYFIVGVFENGNRAAEGEKPQFFAKALHVYF